MPQHPKYTLVCDRCGSPNGTVYDGFEPAQAAAGGSCPKEDGGVMQPILASEARMRAWTGPQEGSGGRT
jgi:hypothetical protein